MKTNLIFNSSSTISDISMHHNGIILRHYGRLRRDYLKNSRPILFAIFVSNGTLYEHCAEIDQAAQQRQDLMMPQLMERDGITEELKEKDPMEWVRRMNACKHVVEEIIKHELIYV